VCVFDVSVPVYVSLYVYAFVCCVGVCVNDIGCGWEWVWVGGLLVRVSTGV